MPEKRKHARVVHRDVVQFEAAGGTVEGYSVDISRNGIQIIVAVPHAFDRVETIRFTVPHAETEVELPVRLIRSDEVSESDGQYRAGFEFLSEAEQEIRLIENYIRDTKTRRIGSDRNDQESRQIPRLDCEIHGACSGSTSLDRIIIQNLSTEGLLLSATGSASVGDGFDLVFPIPGDERTVTVSCLVAYVIADTAGERISLGVRFSAIPEVQRARIRNFIERAAASYSLRSMQERLDRQNSDPGYVIETMVGILDTLDTAQQEASAVYLLIDQDLGIKQGSIRQVIQDHGSPSVSISIRENVPTPERAMVFAGFTVRNGYSHYFTSVVHSVEHLPETGSTVLHLELPARIHRTDKRSSGRSRVFVSNEIMLYLETGRGRIGEILGRLVDTSQRGFLCEVTVAHDLGAALRKGTSINYRVDPRFNLLSHGRIRHITQTGVHNGDSVCLIGVEAGIHRGNLDEIRISADQWHRRIQSSEHIPVPRRSLEARPVRYRNTRNQQISALLQMTDSGRLTGPETNITVVIIPPAFGKRKESLAPLAATILANFANAGLSAVVLRYDGINRPGESHNDTDSPVRGYEMLRYRPSQGMEDMLSTLEFVYNNEIFSPSRVVLVTTSMSSVDARKLLASDSHPVSAWVSLMGVPAARSTLVNVLGGTDIIANYRIGARNGVRAMLGHLVDMDLLAQDLLDRKYAFLTDARLDLASIDLPILWIVGTHDHWVNESEVIDIMSIRSGAERTVLCIPTGHNLRNSEDATEAFRIMTGFCMQQAGYNGPVYLPEKENVLLMIASERERVFRPLEASEIAEYWRSYLLGNSHDSEGYDFYRNLVDFRRFIRDEAELIAPRAGQRIADMGCGTGLLTEQLLRKAAKTADGICGIEMDAVDLIPEALEKAKEKCYSTITALPVLEDTTIRFETKNLEPNRLLPVRDLCLHPELPVRFLKGRIEGLPDRVIEQWAESGEPQFDRYIRGLEPLTDGTEPESDHYAVELNRAARYIRGALQIRDLRSSPPGRSHSEPVETADLYRTDDLVFNYLKFGKTSLPVPPEHDGGIYDSIAASLFISYILNPDYLLAEFHRLLKPGGLLLVSSMRPDSDVSTIFTEYVHTVNTGSAGDRQLEAARAMLNEAAALLELEEDGYFRFYSDAELERLFLEAGFTDIRVKTSLGVPPQACIVTGRAGKDRIEPWSRYV